jgi:hypothetical protein
MKKLIDYMPPMLTNAELSKALTILPEYDDSIRHQSVSQRLIELNKLFDIYLPSVMSSEIYSKLFLSLLRSLQKKDTHSAVQQSYQNRRDISRGIIGGSDSFTILGQSGIGKSSAINRAISLIAPQKAIITESPYRKLAPIICVQTPYDCSVKGLLLEILREVDEFLETDYYKYAIKSRATTDNLIGTVANVCLHSVGLLIIDEIQNVCSKHGSNLMGTLLNLINASGISVAFVGTLETKAFFENSTFQLSRRAIGLEYKSLSFDVYFINLCRTLTKYLYVREDFTLTDDIIQWLYLHSNGITSIVVTLIKDAQEIAILDGSEKLCIQSLTKAYNQRLGLLHNHINLNPTKLPPPKLKTTSPLIDENIENIEYDFILHTVLNVKRNGGDLIDLLRKQINIIEVNIC